MSGWRVLRACTVSCGPARTPSVIVIRERVWICGAPRQAGLSPMTPRAGAFVGMRRGGTGLQTSTDHLLWPGGRIEGRTRKVGAAHTADRLRATLQARSTGGTPVRGTLWRRRQVSWLAGHCGGSGLPEPCARLSDTKWNRHSPLTVAGAAPDSAPKGTTGFPS